MKPKILIADDDAHIREVIRFALQDAGMEIVEAGDGAQALKRFGEAAPDLVVLDVGMPEADGLEVCRELRKTADTPVLFLSARDEEIDRILGLEMGGDDYVTKPFSPRELVARVKTILKRSRREAVPEPVDAPVEHGDLRLDADAHEARLGEARLDLTPLEFAILRTLANGRKRVFSRAVIMETAYAFNIHVSDRTIDSHIRNIRAKLAAAGCSDGIETVHGVGFRIGACKAR